MIDTPRRGAASCVPVFFWLVVHMDCMRGISRYIFFVSVCMCVCCVVGCFDRSGLTRMLIKYDYMDFVSCTSLTVRTIEPLIIQNRMDFSVDLMCKYMVFNKTDSNSVQIVQIVCTCFFCMGCCGVCQAHAYVKNERNTLIDVIVRKAHSICAIKKARCENVILAKVTNVMWCAITPKWSKRHPGTM